MKAGKIVGSRNNIDLSGGELDFYPTPPSSVMGLIRWLEENDPTILTKLKLVVVCVYVLVNGNNSNTNLRIF